MATTFFWHDYETFGVEPKSDRPAQFAGIRTDSDLNEIGEPINIYCKPTQDNIIPSAQSCLITSITPEHCDTNGVKESKFAGIIEKELSEGETVSVGYNSMSFDDEFTRYLFWRNLIDPYAREYKNGCNRWDLYKVVQVFYALSPEKINWPIKDDGTTSFKLEDLCESNGVTHSKAHDALSDVRATIGLARKLKSADPRLFDACLLLRKKDEVKKHISVYKKQPLFHVSNMLGAENKFSAVVFPLAQHPINLNKIIVWDLSQDPSVLKTLSPEEIKIRIFTPKSELPENISRLPVKTISINKSPFVYSDLRILTDERKMRLNINIDLVNKYSEIARSLDLPHGFWENVYKKDYPAIQDVDESLYTGFLQSHDRSMLDNLRNSNETQLSEATPKFTDMRLDELFFRYKARNYYNTLSADEKVRWEKFCSNKLALKLSDFLSECDELNPTLSAKERAFLSGIQSWVKDRMP